MIELGFVSPLRTTVIASTHRLYSIHEKIATGRAIYPQADLQRAAEAGARRLVAFDALTLAREHGTETNAILLGALAASGALPIPDAAYRQAIERKGVAVASNLAGFALGLSLAPRADHGGPAGAPANGAARAEVARADVDDREASSTLASLPAELRPLVEVAAPRGPRPGRTRRDEADRLSGHGVRPAVSRAAAALRPGGDRQCHADGDRPGGGALPGAVDELRGRGARGRSEDAGVAVRAHSRLRAGRRRRDRRDRLPQARSRRDLGRAARPPGPALARWAERRWPHGRPTVGQHVRTTTISGFLRVWLLARLKRLRPISYRAREEHARIARWLDAVQTCMVADAAVAAEVAQAAQLVKGYGDVRRRMLAVHEQIVAGVLRAVTLEAASSRGLQRLARAGRATTRARAAGPRWRRTRAGHHRRHADPTRDRRRGRRARAARRRLARAGYRARGPGARARGTGRGCTRRSRRAGTRRVTSRIR